MIPVKFLTLACAAVLAAGIGAASAAYAQPGGIAPLSVTAAHPTSVTVSIKDKDERTVRKDVGAAAHFVCRNFVGLQGISLDDVDWCADRASTKAMNQYARIRMTQTLAANDAIVLAVR